jgi:hypothetical protein
MLHIIKSQSSEKSTHFGRGHGATKTNALSAARIVVWPEVFRFPNNLLPYARSQMEEMCAIMCQSTLRIQRK